MDRSDLMRWSRPWRAAAVTQLRVIAHLLRWVVLGALSGAVAG